MINTFFVQIKNILSSHKKKVYGLVALAAVAGVLSAGVHSIFEVRGVVTGVGNNSITVANFLRTQTVDLTGAPVSAANIKVGDKIKIDKNLSGDVLFVRTSSGKHREHDDDEF